MSKPLTAGECAEIENRLKVSTEAQWIEGGLVVRSDRGVICTSPTPPNGGVFDCSQNITFIAKAHTDVPALLASYRAAMELLRGALTHTWKCGWTSVYQDCDCGLAERQAAIAAYDADQEGK